MKHIVVKRRRLIVLSLLILVCLSLLSVFLLFDEPKENKERKTLKVRAFENSQTTMRVEKTSTTAVSMEEIMKKEELNTSIDFSSLEIPMQLEGVYIPRSDQNLPAEDLASQRDTARMMQEYQKMQDYEKTQRMHPTSKDDATEWKVDYSVGLEDGSAEELQQGNIDSDMFKHKVGFQKRF